MASMNKRGQVLRSADEKRELIDEYQTSGLSMSEYCRRKGISSTSFYSWVSKDKQTGSVGESKLVRLVPDSAARHSEHAAAVAPNATASSLESAVRELRFELTFGSVLRVSYSRSQR